ncbi:hypothetical protein [Actinokineospora terrae]|uniref:DNA (Cytosine-5)-methyltransferase 1 n=1 Tax=Actinokineospora terrae TaxID=155974 RepID=A0A1H9VH90_9PSEU|nr:hypothetical protein [Actinokineospora terrae]SES20587.1 DNA (cytosine-5)-methyltransferase 1 [Actinokineospora terrae]
MNVLSLTDRVADGLPPGLDAARVTALGNAVIPAIAEHIGRLVLGVNNQRDVA